MNYLTSTNELPGGLLDNPGYRQSQVVMRRIHARGIPWIMGSPTSEPGRAGDTRETQHPAMLTNDYYIGVFPLTRGQYKVLVGSWYNTWFSQDKSLRIQDGIYYRDYQCARGTPYPETPSSTSICGRMRERSGNAIDFDLPSEAEWEYACRAGYGHNT